MTRNYDREIHWSEIEARWNLESELRQKIPRRVMARDGEKTGCGERIFGGCLSLFMLFMFGVGLMMVIWAGLALVILPFGNATPATVVRHEATQGGRRGQTSYFLHFRFQHNGRDYNGEWSVSEDFYQRTRDGEIVTARYFPFAPGARPMLERGTTPWLHILGLGPLGFLMVGVSGLILLGFLMPKRGKNLVKRGLVAPAIVVAIDDENQKITLLFRLGEQTFEIQRKIENRFSMPSLGAVVTVLFPPKSPKKAKIYDFCDFRAR